MHVTEAATISASDLWSRYTNAESHHAQLFAEQRSNILLVHGNHYQVRSSKFRQTLRDMETITRTQKIRLTKNHLQRITKTYVNNLLMYAPTVAIYPRSDKELSDVKVAELHQSVWADMKERHKFKRLTRSWAKDLIEVGEAVAKVFFDENAGHFLGYDPFLDDMGQAVTDPETGEVLYNPAPVMTGDITFERVLGFNLITDPEARSWDEVQWCIYRKMLPVAKLKKLYKNDPAKLAMIVESAEETAKIFDSATGTYRDNEGMVMVTEHYLRPGTDGHHEGYFYFAVQGGVLEEGPLPLGVFPIVYCGFDEATTSARSFSIIKQLRPYTAEVNRAASKIAEHQITLGDDKVILSNGATMTPGGSAHGVKGIHVTGADPKIFPGRTGEQYVGYMNSQISEMYSVAMVEEDSREKESGQIDPFAILYKTASQKKPFLLYIEKFEEFLCEISKLALMFAKEYYHDEMLVPIVGKNEYVNIEEFRKAEPLGFQIKVEPATEDLESRMGKQLALNHLIQFAGNRLAPEDIAKLCRYMPWLNKEQIFDDLTQDLDNWTNDRLAMDRGRYVKADESENHPYIIKKIRGRIKDADFELLPQQVQNMYRTKLQEHEGIQARQLQEAQAAQAGFIPSGGYLVTVQLYDANPEDPTKQKLLKVPSESVMWLVETLKRQGSTQEQLQGLDMASQADIGRMMAQQQSQQQLPPGMPNQAMPMAAGF